MASTDSLSAATNASGGQGLFRQLEFRHQHTVFIHHDQTITLFHDDSFQREARSVSGDDRTERR